MSFSNLMSSAKGPGVIGLLLALIVLGGFIILGTLTLDEAFQGGGKSIGSVIRQQEGEIQSYQSRLKESKAPLVELADRERMAKELGIRTSKISSQQNSLAKTQVTIAQLHEELNTIERALEDYKGHYRTSIRGAAKGTEMEQFETLSGRVYHQVKVREVNAVGMLIRHRNGSKRIPYKDLPIDMQDHFQFDAEEKKAKTAAEALAKKKHLQATAAAQKARNQQNEQNKLEEKRAAAVRQQHAIAAITGRIATLSGEIREFQRSIASETWKKLSRAPQMREQLVKMKRKKQELESKLRTLRSGS